MRTKFLVITALFCAFSISKAQRIAEEKGEFYTKFHNYNGGKIPTMEVDIDLKAYKKFFDKTIKKFNKIEPYKTSFYGKPLSIFLDDLKKNNIIVTQGSWLSYQNSEVSEADGVELQFMDWETNFKLDKVSGDKLNKPRIKVIFDKPFKTAKISFIQRKNEAKWNDELINFYKYFTVKEIMFLQTYN